MAVAKQRNKQQATAAAAGQMTKKLTAEFIGTYFLVFAGPWAIAASLVYKTMHEQGGL